MIRVVVAGAVLGPTFLGNIYQSTNLLPSLLYQLMAGPLIAALLVPPLVAMIDQSGDAAARRFVNAAFSVLTSAFFGAALLAIVSGMVFVRVFTAGVPDESSSAARDATWLLLLLAVPQVVLYGVIGVAMAVQQARGRFGFPAAAQVIENAVVVAVLIAAASRYGSGPSVDTVERGFLVTIGMGTTVAIAVHATAQWLSARQVGFTLAPARGWRHPDVRELLRLAIPTLGGTVIESGRFLAIIAVAGLIPGGVIAVQLGVQFALLPVALGASPVSQAMLPRLSRLRAAGGAGAFREYQNAIGMALWIAIPATLGLAVLSGALAELVAFGEMDNERGIELIRVAIAAFSLGIVGSSVYEVARQASYSARDATGPFRTAILRALITVPSLLVVLFLLDDVEALLVLGAGSALSDAVASSVLDRRVRGANPGARRILGWIARDVALALVAVAVALLVVERGGSVMPDGRLATVAVVGGAAGAAAAIYAGAQVLVGSPEFEGLRSSLRPSGR